MKHVLFAPVLLLLGALPCAPGAADVTYPWEPDPGFAGTGYTYRGPADRVVIDTRVITESGGYAEPAVIVAFWMTDANGENPWIGLQRYRAASGDPWDGMKRPSRTVAEIDCACPACLRASSSCRTGWSISRCWAP